MKMCLVDPKGIHLGMNTGIGYLASYIKKTLGITPKVFDFNNNTSHMDSRIEEIASYDLVGFSMKSFTKYMAIEVARRVKDNVLIAGGPHITLDWVNL